MITTGETGRGESSMATVQAPLVRWRNDRLFYTGMGVLVALIVVTGFARSYYLNPWIATPEGMRRLDGLLHLHGAVFTAWVLLGIVQPALIANRKRRLHRRLGYAGAGLAVLMVILGNVAAVAAMHGGFIGMGDPFAFYIVPFFAIWSFALCVALAVLWRDRAETHKRLMLLASTPLIEAAIARLPFDAINAGAPFTYLLGSDVVIAAGIAYDLVSRGRVHKVWLWGGGLMVASQFLRLAVAQTEPWLAFARMMAGLWTP
jgi:hypothetical protein